MSAIPTIDYFGINSEVIINPKVYSEYQYVRLDQETIYKWDGALLEYVKIKDLPIPYIFYDLRTSEIAITDTEKGSVIFPGPNYVFADKATLKIYAFDSAKKIWVPAVYDGDVQSVITAKLGTVINLSTPDDVRQSNISVYDAITEAQGRPPRPSDTILDSAGHLYEINKSDQIALIPLLEHRAITLSWPVGKRLESIPFLNFEFQSDVSEITLVSSDPAYKIVTRQVESTKNIVFNVISTEILSPDLNLKTAFDENSALIFSGSDLHLNLKLNTATQIFSIDYTIISPASYATINIVTSQYDVFQGPDAAKVNASLATNSNIKDVFIFNPATDAKIQVLGETQSVIDIAPLLRTNQSETLYASHKNISGANYIFATINVSPTLVEKHTTKIYPAIKAMLPIGTEVPIEFEKDESLTYTFKSPLDENFTTPVSLKTSEPIYVTIIGSDTDNRIRQVINHTILYVYRQPTTINYGSVISRYDSFQTENLPDRAYNFTHELFGSDLIQIINLITGKMGLVYAVEGTVNMAQYIKDNASQSLIFSSKNTDAANIIVQLNLIVSDLHHSTTQILSRVAPGEQIAISVPYIKNFLTSSPKVASGFAANFTYLYSGALVNASTPTPIHLQGNLAISNFTLAGSATIQVPVVPGDRLQLTILARDANNITQSVIDHTILIL